MKKRIMSLFLIACLFTLTSLPTFASDFSILSTSQLSIPVYKVPISQYGTEHKQAGSTFVVTESNTVIKFDVVSLTSSMPTINVGLFDITTNKSLDSWLCLGVDKDSDYNIEYYIPEEIKGHALMFVVSTYEQVSSTAVVSFWTEN